MNQKCCNCNSTWNTENVMDKCPFCGKSLIKKETLSLSSAISVVVKENGIDILNKPNRFLSYIMDYVKGEEKDKRLLRIACNTTALQYVVQATKSDTQKEKDILLTKAKITIENEVFFSEENAQYIIRIIANGVGLSYRKEYKNSNAAYKIEDNEKSNAHFANNHSERTQELNVTKQPEDNKGESYLMSLVKTKKRVSQEDNKEIFLLGRSKLQGKDTMVGIDLIRFSAQHGFKAAAFLLGYCYEKGVGVSKDINVAKAYYRQGAMSNPDFERYSQTGNGLNLDGFKKAAEYGAKLYQSKSNTIPTKNKSLKTPTADVQHKTDSNERSKRIFLPYRERSQAYLSNIEHLAHIILTNEKSSQDDYEQIFEWGRKYIRESNYTEAFKFIQFAAKHGLKEASLLLGYMYDNGYGVQQDKKAARGYYWQGVASVERYKGYYANGLFSKTGYKKAADDGNLLFIRS
ncbi:MAG: tetratricopeptide repeat protein [Ruminococcus sp.]|nr:tetratricopeptide repeat protein [Ruminococcus sp.]